MVIGTVPGLVSVIVRVEVPPGIAESQWPLSPFDGFPMQPCFTLRLPEQYRAKGPDYVALAMFADWTTRIARGELPPRRRVRKVSSATS